MTCTLGGGTAVQQYFDTPVAEGKTCQFTGYLMDAAGDNLTLLQLATITLDALTLTLYDYASETIIGVRNAQDILNLNGGIVADVTVNGVARLRFTLTLGGGDNAMIDPDLAWEPHVARREWTYDGATVGRGELSFTVQRLTAL